MTDVADTQAEAGEAADGHDASAAREFEAQAPANEPVAPPGNVFARRRAELGMSLEDVANQLKFSARQIGALEAGEFEKLPGGTFARGMIRSYARLLKIDPELIHDQLSVAGGTPRVALEEAVSLRAPIPFSEGGNHINLMYAVLSVLLLAVVAFFAFQWYQEKGGAGKLSFVRPTAAIATGNAQRAAPVDPQAGAPVLPPLHPETAALAGAGPALSAETAPPAGAGAQPAGSVPADRSSPDMRRDAAQASAAMALAASPTAPPVAVTSAGPGKRRIQLHFDRQSWVEIKAAKGAILMSQLNPAGTEKLIEGDPPFDLTIGNATGVRLKYNDQPVDLRPYFHVDVARLTLN